MGRRLVLGVLAGVAVAACGGASPHDRVEAYVKAANAVQVGAAPAFIQANRSYARFARRQLDDAGDVRALSAAEAAIRRTEARLARIPAPPPARRLRARLLRVYRLNAGLAHETVLLARYAPARRRVLAAVAQANRRLAAGLAHARQPGPQAAVLTAYRRRLSRSIAALRRLEPPPVAATLHRRQLKRLTASRRLAGALRTAVLARDARRTARLVIAFREVGNVRAGERALEARDLAAYAARRRAIGLAAADLKREQARLERLK